MKSDISSERLIGAFEEGVLFGENRILKEMLEKSRKIEIRRTPILYENLGTWIGGLILLVVGGYLMYVAATGGLF